MRRKETVIFGYRLILGRDPESEEVILQHQTASSDAELGRILCTSTEFRWRSKEWLPIWPETRWVCAEIRGGIRLWLDLHDSYVSFGCLADRYEPSETEFILRQLEPGDCFMDCGANIGWSTLLAAREVGPTGQVIAFEPRQDIFRMLERSIAENGFQDRVAIHRCALWAEQSKFFLHINLDSLNPGGTHLACRTEAKSADTCVNLRREEVSVRPIDDFTPSKRVKLIKIDIEGAESSAIRGATKLISRDKPIIVSEIYDQVLRNVSDVSAQDYCRQLSELGYDAYELRDGRVGGLLPSHTLQSPNPFNVVFLHRIAHAHCPDLGSGKTRETRALP